MANKTRKSPKSWHQHPSHNLPRDPSMVLYPEDQAAKDFVEKHFKKLMGREYNWAKVRRIMLHEMKEKIKKETQAVGP